MLPNLLVVEIASVLAGPLCGMFFAELGARVIKVENARTKGDVTRSWRSAAESAEDDISAYFASANFGKESIALDFTNTEDMRLVLSIVSRADILLHNFKKGDDLKFGLSYEQCSVLNPKLIYAHISGYGSEDNRTGYDAVIQAESGFMSMNGEPGTPPTKLPVALMDILAAHHLKEGILLALLERAITGKGSHVHVSLMDAALASLANQATNYLMGGFVPQQSGSNHPNIAPYGTLFSTKDEKLILFAVGTDSQFSALCSLLGIDELARDEHYSTNKARVLNRSTLHKKLQAAIASHNATELMFQCQQQHIPAGVVNSMDEVMNLPQAQTMLLQTNASKAMSSIAFQRPAPSSLRPPPHYNEHGDALRREFTE